MEPGSSQDAIDPLRPALIRAAYRMLGSVADAEDVVQDAFLRWLDVDRDAVREPAAFLRRVVTRLCLDRLKSVRRERVTYVGPCCRSRLWNRARMSWTTLLCHC
jgi:RNA polymerase sigma-70 factor (ECF subfamily)